MKTQRTNSRGRNILKTLAREKYLYILLIPGLILFLLFCYYPMYGLLIAFKDFNPMEGILGSEFVGMKHFNKFFGSIYFGRLLKNTILLSLYNLIIGFPIPIVFALFLNEAKTGKFKKFTQTVSYLPHFISVVVIVGLMNMLFAPTGLVPDVLTKLFGSSPSFLTDPKMFRTMYIGSEVWQHFGWNSIIYLAALSGIDQGLYEAAKIDGANKIKQIWYITLPGIAPTIITLLILNCGSLLSVGFEKIILMYSPATYSTADVISTYSYRVGLLQSQYSFGVAVGLFNSAANCVILVLVNWVSRKLSDTSLW